MATAAGRTIGGIQNFASNLAGVLGATTTGALAAAGPPPPILADGAAIGGGLRRRPLRPTGFARRCPPIPRPRAHAAADSTI
jgi:hypothetical protein